MVARPWTCYVDQAPIRFCFQAKITGITLKPGWRVRLETPGGGGYGDPSQRDRQKSRRDMQLGFVTGSAEPGA